MVRAVFSGSGGRVDWRRQEMVPRAQMKTAGMRELSQWPAGQKGYDNGRNVSKAGVI